MMHHSTDHALDARTSAPPKTAGPPLPSRVRLTIPEAERARQYPDRSSMALGDHEEEPRAGDLIRTTTERMVVSHCPTCGRRPRTAGSAAAHARRSRHKVLVRYSTAFSYEPADHRDEGWIA